MSTSLHICTPAYIGYYVFQKVKEPLSDYLNVITCKRRRNIKQTNPLRNPELL